jgi:hypothetical protein
MANGARIFMCVCVLTGCSASAASVQRASYSPTVAGTLDFGETRELRSSAPGFHVLRFQVPSPASIAVNVQSEDSDKIVCVVFDDADQILAVAGGTPRAAELHAHTPRSGTYYVGVLDAASRGEQFRVTLARGDAVRPGRDLLARD